MASNARLAFMASQQITPAVINALLNGGIAWAMHRHSTSLGLWSSGGYGLDLIATGLLLPGITWLILHPLLCQQARNGRAPSLAGLPMPALVRWLPGSLWGGALAAGALGTVIGLLMAGVMQALGAPSFGGTSYALFKAAYGAVFPILLQPAMVFAILGVPAAPPQRSNLGRT